MRKQSLLVLALMLGLTGCAANPEQKGEDSVSVSESNGSQVSQLDPKLKKDLDEFKEDADELYGQFRRFSDETLSSAERQDLKREVLDDYHDLFEEADGEYNTVAKQLSSDNELSKSIKELKDSMNESAKQLEAQDKESLDIPDFDLDPMTQAMKQFENDYNKANSLR